MASNEGFLTEGQREMLKIASQNAENLSSSPKSPSTLLADHHHIKAPAGGKAQTAGIAVRHVRRSHSGKLGRAKKGELCVLWIFYFELILYAMLWLLLLRS
jgi:hypothetical protein